MNRKKPYRPYSGKRRSIPWLKILCALIALALAVFLALEAVVIFHARDNVRGEPGAMVILGAQLKSDGPSRFLRRRLEKALDYLEDHPDVIVVVSGGQGPDEPDSEANGMEQFLRNHGFEGTILKEDNSHNTRQNLKNSKEVLAGAGYDVSDGVILVSNDFHLARTKLLGNRFGYRVSLLSAKSDHMGHKIYGFLREPIGLVKSALLDW